MKPRLFVPLLLLCLLATVAVAQDTLIQKPKKVFSHKVGALWNMVTNNGYWGNTYAEPNFEWPGGSGNLYGWRTSIWVGAILDSIGYTSYGDGNHFVPLDTIHVKTRAEGALSAQDTYTRYTDINPPTPTGIHQNLGVIVTERTYAWDQSYNDDFIITDYWITNAGDDRDKDGIIDTTRTLTGIYIGFRLDADVSGFAGSGTTATLWDQDDLASYNHDNRIAYVFDADNPKVPGDDTGNPDPVSGILRSPGYIGIRMLQYDSAHFAGVYTGKPTMGTPSQRYSEPTSSTAIYEFMKNNGLQDTATWVTDYRAILAVGPFTLAHGDSLRIAVAWVIGNGLEGMLKNSQTAQTLFDNGYVSGRAPNEPLITMASGVVGGLNSNLVRWDKSAESSIDPISGSVDFDGYAIYRTLRQDAGGNPIWDTLAVYAMRPLRPDVDSAWIGRSFLRAWPPDQVVIGGDTLYQFIDQAVTNGLIYTYAVAAFDTGDVSQGVGRLENQIGRGRPSTVVYMANNPLASTADRVRVVPNPFVGSSRFNNPNPIETNPWVSRIRFINLPPDATITIFTLAGDLVRTISGGEVVYRSRDVSITGDFRGVAEWDLTTKNDQEVVSGLYIYVVESPSGTHTGKFVIMR